MPFEKGKKIPKQGQGRPKGSQAAQMKYKFLREWQRKFNKYGPKILDDLAKNDPVKFLELGIHFMPKVDEDSGSNDGDLASVTGITPETKRRIREEVYGIYDKADSSTGS